MSHSVYNLPGKTTRQKPARVPLVCLEENQKTNLDPRYVCPKLQVQATFYCQHVLLRNWFHFPFFKGNENKYVYYIFVFDFSQIQDARNCSTQSVYVFCSPV